MNESPRQKRAQMWTWVYTALFGIDEAATDEPADTGDADESVTTSEASEEST